MQAISGDILKHTVEQGQTNATSVISHLFKLAIPLKTHFNCDWCGKYMVSDSALREHIERHIQERSPFITLGL